MPPTTQLPDPLRPYRFHGVRFEYRPDREEQVGECPLCGRAGKWYVNAGTGRWKCHPCGKGGHHLEFVQELLKGAGRPSAADLGEVCRDRGLTDPATPAAWGMRKSPLTGLWLLPGYDPAGAVANLYKWAKDPQTGRRAFYATPGLRHGIHLPDGKAPDPKAADLYVCEGPWDGMAWWEALGLTKRADDGYAHTSARGSSLLAAAAVVAPPGCSVWDRSWGRLTKGRRVHWCYDSDQPREHPPGSKQYTQPGLDGMRRNAAAVSGPVETRPAQNLWLRWGPDGYDPDRPSGWDLRDAVRESGPSPQDRARAVGGLLARFQPVPDDWTKGAAVSRNGKPEATPLRCDRWKTVRDAWRKAMKWPEPGRGLDRGLITVLACVASTDLPGDQLWVQLIGPPSTGKSNLCEALSISEKHVRAVSTLTGFHSGFKTDRKGSEDHSLVGQLAGKTFVLKDGDTLLKAPNRDQILAEARDIYDRKSRVSYRHGLNREYDLSMTWVLAGTEALRELDKNDLGQRFLACVAVGKVSREDESDINRRSGGQLLRQLASGAAARDGDTPEKLLAKRLTGGYVEWLRDNAPRLSQEVAANTPDSVIDRIDSLAQMTAFLRARPSTTQDEAVTRELSARLQQQLIRLAVCVAVVLQQPTVNEQVMEIVRRTALDTGRGRSRTLVRYLSRCGAGGAPLASLSAWTGESEDKCRSLLRFLKRIGACDSHRPEDGPGKGRVMWTLTDWMREVYEAAQDDEE